MQDSLNVLWFMSHPGQVRNFESTLRGLADRGHHVHMAFERLEKKNLPGLHDLSDTLVRDYPGITSGESPVRGRSDWSLVGSRLRASLDYMRYFNAEYADAPKLRERAERWAPADVSRRYSELAGPGRAAMRKAVRLAERSTPLSERVVAYIRDRAPDVVLVTPLLEPGSPQVEFLRAANGLGIPTGFCVASWDNLTNKGLIHELPDAMMVWNDFQRDEAIELHQVPEDRVVVTGAVPYDHWFGWTPSRGREEFAAAAGLDPTRPFVLYVGSSGFIAPDEAGYIVEWLRELKREGLGDVQVIVRPHPVNPLHGDTPSQLELARLDNVHLYPPEGANPTNDESRRDYFDSMYYSSAVAGVNTTAFLEAAIVGRPVFTVLAEHYDQTQRGVLHFQHLLTAGGGLLYAADTYAQHASELGEALAAPHPEGCVSERSQRFTAAFIRPYGLDEPATPRMLSAIEEIAARDKQPSSVVSKNPTGRALSRAALREVTKERERRRREKESRAVAAAKRTKAGKAGAADADLAKGAKPPKAVKGEKAAKAKAPKADRGLEPREKRPKPRHGNGADAPQRAQQPASKGDAAEAGR
jgi:hypothetical protein